jgi:hypothetical protein
MGWVQKKIREHQQTAESLVPLWNSLRDSVGDAVAEFKTLVSQPGVDHGDCRARGTLCVRVQKPGRFVEIFLSQSDQTIRIAGGSIDLAGSSDDGKDREICRYRLRESGSGLEFFRNGEGAMSADDVARAALETFLFDPFPANIKKI